MILWVNNRRRAQVGRFLYTWYQQNKFSCCQLAAGPVSSMEDSFSLTSIAWVVIAKGRLFIAMLSLQHGKHPSYVVLRTPSYLVLRTQRLMQK